jgi:hypothetical protein
LSCCKCQEKDWIEIDGTSYCMRHGEARLLEKHREQESAKAFVRKSPRDGQATVKLMHNGQWVTVEGHVNSMELKAAKPDLTQSISVRGEVMVAKGLETLVLEMIPSKIIRHTEEPQV